MSKRLFIFCDGSNDEPGRCFSWDEEKLNNFDDFLSELSHLVSFPVHKLILTPQNVIISSLEHLRDGDCLKVSHRLIQEEEEEEETRKKSEKCSDVVRLNVGGRIFVTTRTTITSHDCMLSRMISSDLSPGHSDETGAIIIDRSPLYFEPILNFMRTGKVILDPNCNPEGVIEEARYYAIDSMIPLLRPKLSRPIVPLDKQPLTRRDVINLIVSTNCDSKLRFQGVNLSGADLSKLDLRNIDFGDSDLKGCNFKGANLSYANMERVEADGAIFDYATLFGVKMICAQLIKARFVCSNFDDPSGATAMMEGANLNSVNMEGSSMAKVNLRVSSLRNGNLKNCDLRFAIFAGADLEECNFTGSDLAGANLRGSNLTNTILERMRTPLHMSQTVR